MQRGNQTVFKSVDMRNNSQNMGTITNSQKVPFPQQQHMNIHSPTRSINSLQKQNSFNGMGMINSPANDKLLRN